MNKLSLIYTTCKDKAEAKHLSQLLLQERLIACSNIITDMNSFFTWQDKLENSSEVVLLLKTISGHFDKIELLVNKHHSYDTPCLFSLPIQRCSQKFAHWVQGQVSPSEAE